MKRLLVLVLMAICLHLVGQTALAEIADDSSDFTPFSSLLEHLQYSGWVDTVHSVQIHSPNKVLTSRVRLRLETTADFDWLYAFFSIDAEKNWKIDDQSGINTHQFWLEHVGNGWDMRIGRQIVIWGKADGVQVTDIVSPPDLTESMTRDLDEIRMPVDAAKFRLLGDMVDTELILIPVFKAAKYPTGDNPWALPVTLPEQIQVASAREPSVSLKNTEVALKVSAYLSGLDLAASFFHTWDDHPALHPRLNSEGELTIVPEHHRLTVYGLEFSRPWGDFVFRGETAYCQGRYLPSRNFLQGPDKKDVFKWLGGVDWTPGNDWTLTAQILGDCILGHHAGLAGDKNSLMGTLNISKQMLRQTLALSNMLYCGLTDGDSYNRFKVEYEITDNFHLIGGLDLFSGNDGHFGVYTDNSQLWFKAKYSF